MSTEKKVEQHIEIHKPKVVKPQLNLKKKKDGNTRAPPLEVVKGNEVLVVNGDRSNLSWKRYNLIEINQRTGMCIVEGIANGQQRNFPRSVVKPKDWIDKFKTFFRTLAATEDDDDQKSDQKKDHKSHHNFVEYHNFKIALDLLGARYNHGPMLKIFKSLDVRANGTLSFGQFMNWIYGLGRVQDRGRLLTTMECVLGLRKWKNSLPYYVMDQEVGDEKSNNNGDELEKEGINNNESIWDMGIYDSSKTTAEFIHLLTDGDDEIIPREIKIPCNIHNFAYQLRSRLEKYGTDEFKATFYPSHEEERDCSLVVMGPGEIGKSALINKFVKGVFPHDYDPTIQDHLRKQILVADKPALLDILDTAGQDEFASMRYDWLKDNIDVLVICFSRSEHESFVTAKQLINISKRLLKILSSKPRIVPILLVSCKSDLYDNQIEVTDEEVDELRALHGGEDHVGYVECSAFMDENINDVFNSAVILYRKWRLNKAGIQVHIPTLQEVQARARQRSHIQNFNNKASVGKSRCINCLSVFCPATAAYLESSAVSVGDGKLAIARVPKDKFGDELAAPSYSKKQFFVQREMSWSKCGVSVLTAFFFPFVLLYQSFLFVFYCSSTNCCFKCLPSSTDFTESASALLHDFLGSVVGRDPRESAKDKDSRKWFLSQTFGQKIARIGLCFIVVVLFGFAFYNAATLGTSYGGNTDSLLSVMEYGGPLQLWVAMWIVLAFYLSLRINVVPTPPTMQSLRPFVMYLNLDESIRTTAYVFLRGFAKSTLEIFRLDASKGHVISSFIIAVIWCFIPGLIRKFLKQEGGSEFFPEDNLLQAITSMIINFVFGFFLVLGLQLQTQSGLNKYIEWMDNITSMLDEEFSSIKRVNYLNLTRHNNTLAWLEMRTYLYTKGLIIFSRQEIFVAYVIFLQVFSAFYTVWRLMSEVKPEDAYGSPSFVGVLFLFLLLTYALLRILRTTRSIENLQIKQIALLSSQKFQIYYKRITWHPEIDNNEQDEDQDELDEGYEDDINYNSDNTDDDDDFGIDLDALPHFDEHADYSDDAEEDSHNNKEEEEEENKENKELLITKQTKTKTKPIIKSFVRGPTKLKLQNTHTLNNKDNGIGSGESMFSAEYLEQSEKFVQSTITICEAQDIIPRVFNIKIHVAVGLSILSTTFAVLPTAGRLAFGSDCGTWSD